jgi:hypothetical protein
MLGECACRGCSKPLTREVVRPLTCKDSLCCTEFEIQTVLRIGVKLLWRQSRLRTGVVVEVAQNKLLVRVAVAEVPLKIETS